MKSHSRQDSGKIPQPTTTAMLLQGFDGGIVCKADVALQLAMIIFPEIAEGPPPAIGDRGDQWLIRINRSEDDANYVSIRKLDAAILADDGWRLTHALPNSKIAEKFTTILIESNYGDDELARQIPFTIINEGSTWRVSGRGDPNRADGGNGRFHLDVQKHDAQVLNMSFQWGLPVPKEITNLLS